MKRSNRLAVLVLAVLGVLVVAGIALAAYTKPRLTIAYSPNTVQLGVAADQNEDATASASIILPAGTTVNSSQAPGSTIGSVKATVSALALGGALLPLSGPIIVAPPGAVPAASQAACTRGAPVTAIWILALELSGQKISLPAYVMPTSAAEAAIGPVKVVFCISPPDVPVSLGGAPNGAKFVSADLTIKGVFSPVSAGVAVSFWTPYEAGNGKPNAAATVASPAGIAPGAVSVKVAKISGLKSKVTGKVTQGGAPVGGATVQIWAGLKKTSLKKVGTAKTKADGSYSFGYGKAAAFFRARTVVGATPAPGLCAKLQPALPVPCVNGSLNPFVGLSPIAKR